MALTVPAQPASTLGIPPRVVDVLTFPVRAAVAFGQASIGVARLVARDGVVDRALEPGGALDRILAQEGAIDRMLAPGGVIDRLLDREGLIEQLVAEDGIIDRLGDLMVNVERLGPVLEPLGPLLDGVREAAAGIDGSARGLDRSASELVALLEPVVDVVSRIPGARRRRPAVAAPAPTAEPDRAGDATIPGITVG